MAQIESRDISTEGVGVDDRLVKTSRAGSPGNLKQASAIQSSHGSLGPPFDVPHPGTDQQPA
jgi:hypothetical protein